MHLGPNALYPGRLSEALSLAYMPLLGQRIWPLVQAAPCCAVLYRTAHPHPCLVLPLHDCCVLRSCAGDAGHGWALPSGGDGASHRARAADDSRRGYLQRYYHRRRRLNFLLAMHAVRAHWCVLSCVLLLMRVFAGLVVLDGCAECA